MARVELAQAHRGLGIKWGCRLTRIPDVSIASLILTDIGPV